MASLSPCSRADFIRKLIALGYDGPFAGGKHQFMTKHGSTTLTVPHPHHGAIEVRLLRRILHAANLSRNEWNNA